MASVEAYIRNLPKAELHLHIEGTLEPELAVRLARKNGVALPYASVAELRAAYDFRDLHGEEGPPAYVRAALDQLAVRRIDHGVRCEEDPELVRRLVREQTALTVCPLSNVRLRVFDRIEDHNLKRLLEAGLRVTVNSDDPAYFGGYLLENYLTVERALGLTRAQLATLARNSIEASFLDAAAKHRWIAAIDLRARHAERHGD